MSISAVEENFDNSIWSVTTEVEETFSGWDRTLFKASSWATEPFCFGFEMLRFRLVAPLKPNEFDNCDTLAKEIGVRLLIGTSAIGIAGAAYVAPIPVIGGALALGLTGRALKAAAFALQKDNFTHVLGQLPEKDVSDRGVLIRSYNVVGIAAGMTYDHGGVRVWRNRVEPIIHAMREQDLDLPDVLILNEVYDTACAEAFIEKLKKEYAHIYCHAGNTILGSEGGVMVFSKCAVQDVKNITFTTSDWTLRRGFFAIELKTKPTDSYSSARVIATHLIHGNEEEDRNTRRSQMDQILTYLASRAFYPLPTVLAGDLNVERDSKEAEDLFQNQLHHSYLLDQPTATNVLRDRNWYQKKDVEPDEIIDFVSIFDFTVPGCAYGALEPAPMIESFADWRKFPLSDHNSVAARLILGNS